MILEEVTDGVRNIFNNASRVCVLTGAGISAESGVPTFRGGGGAAMWTWRGKPLTQLSSAELLATDPKLVWEWFDYRRGLLTEVHPNPGHKALAEWENKYDDFTLVTQNIDNLHRIAGNRNILELHGNLWYARCLKCASVFEAPETPLKEIPPKCPDCGGNARPHVVLFGELLPLGVFDKAEEAASRAELFFVIGTSAVVYPAASLPAIASEAGAAIIEVNPELTEISNYADYTILGKAGEVLPAFMES